MKKLLMALAFIGILIFTGCKDEPSSGQIREQYNIVSENVKNICGEEYNAENFTELEKGYSNSENTEYSINFTFDLNKPYLMFDKGIPGKLHFSKKDNKWICDLNSGNLAGGFNLFK